MTAGFFLICEAFTLLENAVLGIKWSLFDKDPGSWNLAAFCPRGVGKYAVIGRYLSDHDQAPS